MKKYWKIAFALVLLAIFAFSYLYRVAFKENVVLSISNYLYIPTNSNFKDVLDGLNKNNFIMDKEGFIKLAKIKKYHNNIKPGKYKLTNGMSNNDLINTLRSGRQEQVKVYFNYARTKKDLARKICMNLEADSTELVKLLNDPDVCADYGLTTNNIVSLFIPNTYYFYWNTSAQQLLERMHKEHNKFWNKDRLKKANDIGLSPAEVSTLASIVTCETTKSTDAPIIAGVYINRLKKGMLLQADPTLKFAKKEFNIQRVLNKDKLVDSPYNTYKYKGLPPGPIYIPSSSYLDHVLNYTRHKYLFFCAKEDLSGYSNFARTNLQHSRNARRYQRALNRRGIRR